ncbi:MAG: LuxR C-terminal-related transcriptional regulator [Lachnospiraceae bacterium]|nr:LuxR C-terminal-related transcriptional regulator [Lachnospiraceae bacterium]
MEKRAEDALESALQWVVPDGLWLLAAEFEPGEEKMMRRVAFRFSPEAAEKIHDLGKNFWKKIEIIRKSEEKAMPEVLTKREWEIVKLLTDHSNSEIAQILHISDKTVKRHVENIYAKLGINRRGQVADAIKGVLTSNTAFWVKK